MNPDARAEVMDKVRLLESETSSLRRLIDTQDIPIGDRRYLARCFDLLEMELLALRQFVEGLS